MAYPAVISLKQTLYRILHSSQNSLNTPSSKILLQSAYNQVTSLQQILNRLDNFRSDLLNSFEEQIRDEAHQLEDSLEFHELNHFLAPSEDTDVLNEATQVIKSFSPVAEKITNICISEIGPELEEEEAEDEDDDDKVVPSDHHRIYPFDYDHVKASLTERTRPNDFGVFQITGLPGCGATIAAATIFEDLKHCFDCRAWIHVGPRYEWSALLLTILHQINDNHELILDGKGDEEIEEFIRASLKSRKYLIVMDDIRSPEMWSFVEVLFPVQDNGSAVVFTTRGEEYVLREIRNSLMLYNMACRNQDSWWYLFSGAMFGSERCPYELVEAGKKIVANCKSLGIVVLKVILLLLKREKTPQCWNQLAEDEDNPVFMVGDEIYEIRIMVNGTKSSSAEVTCRICRKCHKGGTPEQRRRWGPTPLGRHNKVLRFRKSQRRRRSRRLSRWLNPATKKKPLEPTTPSARPTISSQYGWRRRSTASEAEIGKARRTVTISP